MMKRKRRVNQLKDIGDQVVKLSPETCPEFEGAERLFYSEQKARTAELEKSASGTKDTVRHRENNKADHKKQFHPIYH